MSYILEAALTVPTCCYLRSPSFNHASVRFLSQTVTFQQQLSRFGLSSVFFSGFLLVSSVGFGWSFSIFARLINIQACPALSGSNRAAFLIIHVALRSVFSEFCACLMAVDIILFCHWSTLEFNNFTRPSADRSRSNVTGFSIKLYMKAVGFICFLFYSVM